MTNQQSISIDSGLKSIPISVDGKNVHELEFDTNDLLFIKKLHAIYFEAKQKVVELQEAEKQKPEVDENGMIVDFEQIKIQTEEINIWFKEKIDNLIGDGSSQKIFGNKIYSNPSVYVQLINGLFEIVGLDREPKVAKYVKKQK